MAGKQPFLNESSLFLAISSIVKRIPKAPDNIDFVLPFLRRERNPQDQYMLSLVNIELLSKCPKEIAIRDLLLDLDCPLDKVRLKALEVIVQFKDDRVLAAVKKRLSDKDESVRKLAKKEYAKVNLLNK